jgi:hypothetical protein
MKSGERRPQSGERRPQSIITNENCKDV